MKRPSYLTAVIVAALGLAGPGCAVAQDQTEPATPPAAADAALDAPVDLAKLPHVRIDREARVVELDAKVVTREADWLELIACTPGSREYESILTTAARHSHIHLALLAVGLEPGNPQTFKEDPNPEKPYIRIPAAGPPVVTTIAYQREGKPVEVPATDWIIDQQSKAKMPDQPWLFTGSQFVDYEGKKVYLADLNGTVLSLVNFGDDLLARNTEATNQTDNSAWGPNTEVIPAVGTEVKIRLRPAADQPQTPKP